MPSNTPDNFALVIGAMKSGTTTLFEVLSRHPEIAGCATKEPRYFAEPKTWEQGWAWYTDLWSWDPDRHRVALEASPAYTTAPARPGVPGRIASVSDATFRFIYILRNPFDQIQSNVRHTLYVGWGTSLDEGVPEWMIETVQYAMQIDQYLAHFPRESLLLLTLEAYQRDPEAELRRICRFLEVDESFVFEGADRKYNSGEAYEVAAPVATVMRSGFARWMAGTVLSPAMKHRIRSMLSRFRGKQETPLGRHVLTDEEKASLRRRLLPDLRRLDQEFGIAVERDWSIDLGD